MTLFSSYYGSRLFDSVSLTVRYSVLNDAIHIGSEFRLDHSIQDTHVVFEEMLTEIWRVHFQTNELPVFHSTFTVFNLNFIQFCGDHRKWQYQNQKHFLDFEYLEWTIRDILSYRLFKSFVEVNLGQDLASNCQFLTGRTHSSCNRLYGEC